MAISFWGSRFNALFWTMILNSWSEQRFDSRQKNVFPCTPKLHSTWLCRSVHVQTSKDDGLLSIYSRRKRAERNSQTESWSWVVIKMAVADFTNRCNGRIPGNRLTRERDLTGASNLRIRLGSRRSAVLHGSSYITICDSTTANSVAQKLDQIKRTCHVKVQRRCDWISPPSRKY